MRCDYRNEKEHPVCKLGMYGGMPSAGTCKRCIDKGENTPEHAEKQKEYHNQTRSTLCSKASGLVKSIVNWKNSNFSIAPKEILDSRIEICKVCEFWNPKGFNSTGRCEKCGCSTWAKLRMATESCPIGKW